MNSPWETLRTSFLESMRVRGLAPATLRTRRDALETFFRWLDGQGHGQRQAREITPETLRAYHQWLVGRPLKVRTVHVKLLALRIFFQYLENTGVVLFNPCARMKLPRLGERIPSGVLTQEEARRLLDAPDIREPKGLRDKALLELFYSTGIRGAEMAALTLQDVDCKNGFVRVVRGKGARDRVVPMGVTAAGCLRDYLAKARRPWSLVQKDQRALWLSAIQPHGPLLQQAIAVLVRNYKKQAGIQRPGRTHLWRHTCATHLVQSGANLLCVQRLLGHRHLETTQVYTRVAAAEAAATMRRTHPRAKSKATAPALKPRMIRGPYGYKNAH